MPLQLAFLDVAEPGAVLGQREQQRERGVARVGRQPTSRAQKRRGEQGGHALPAHQGRLEAAIGRGLQGLARRVDQELVLVDAGDARPHRRGARARVEPHRGAGADVHDVTPPARAEDRAETLTTSRSSTSAPATGRLDCHTRLNGRSSGSMRTVVSRAGAGRALEPKNAAVEMVVAGSSKVSRRSGVKCTSSKRVPPES